jgi:hypothetical protein
VAAKPLVQVIGADAARRDLIRFAGQPAIDAFVAAGVAVAEPVAARARAKLPKGPTKRLSGSVRVARIRTGAALRFGGGSIPYAGPVEFGGWPRGRPFIAGGRYVFPTALGMAPAAADQYSQRLDYAINRYPWEQAR